MTALPSFETLRAGANKPRVHPNGFIQLDMDDRFRIHVWHPMLPYRQKTYHPIHDHVFSFNSLCFSGRLIHVPYGIEINGHGTHQLWSAKCIAAEETILEPTGAIVKLIPALRWVHVVQPGQGYTFQAFAFHETLASEPTMTVVEKHGPTLQQGAKLAPRIAVPVGITPDNDFRREDHNEDVLWSLIKEAHPNV